MNNKHFEFTNETINVKDHVLHRIRATRDIPEFNIRKGTIGGFVESYDNLRDNAWVYDDAHVYEDAVVYGNAKVRGRAEVFGDTQVFDNAEVCGRAKVFENAFVHGKALVCGYAQVHGYAKVAGNAVVCGSAEVYEDAKVCGHTLVYGDARISGDAVVTSDRDYIVFKNFWSSGRYFTWTRSNNMWHVGCFYGTGKELIKKAYKDSEESGRQYENIVNYVNTCVIGVK